MAITNPFAGAELAGIPADAMQIYVVLMVALVIIGTILDMMHKKSAQYFFENAKKAEKAATKQISSGDKTSMAIKTLTNEVLTSSEFASTKRRLSHLLTMYGFIFMVAATAVLIFAYPKMADASIWPFVWHLGAFMLAAGGYWFWFGIRVDLASEGKAWNQISLRADLFIVSLLAMSTFGLLWSFTDSIWLFALFIVASTTLFSTVFWSKFAHMFFKPAAAYQKRTTKADGSRENLPADFDLSDPQVHARFPDIPEYMGKNPENMGPGIKREEPRHF